VLDISAYGSYVRSYLCFFYLNKVIFADLKQGWLKTLHSEQECAFWGVSNVPINFESQPPKTEILVPWIEYDFQAWMAKSPRLTNFQTRHLHTISYKDHATLGTTDNCKTAFSLQCSRECSYDYITSSDWYVVAGMYNSIHPAHAVYEITLQSLNMYSARQECCSCCVVTTCRRQRRVCQQSGRARSSTPQTGTVWSRGRSQVEYSRPSQPSHPGS